MRQKTSGFSLVEVTLALGIIAFGIVAILGLIPVGMKSGSEAIDATHSALIGKEAQSRTQSSVTSATFGSAADITLPTWYYDRDGTFIGTTVTANSFYRADATIRASWGANAPPNINATVLRPVTLELRWPVNISNGNPLGSNASAFTFYVRRP